MDERKPEKRLYRADKTTTTDTETDSETSERGLNRRKFIGAATLLGLGGSALGGLSAPVAAEVVSSWSQQQKLLAAEGVEGDQLGDSVALSGDTALVGAPGVDQDGNFLTGAAYVFVQSGGTWSQEAKLTADDAAQADQLGESVALSGDTALVGAPFTDAGSAYVFVRSGSTWSQEAELVADDAALDDRFGWSVALSGRGRHKLNARQCDGPRLAASQIL